MVGEDTTKDQQQEKKIYNRYAVGIVAASVALSVITPNIIEYIEPEALDIDSIAIMNPIAYTISSIALSAVAIDKAANRFIKFDLGLIKSIADVFGAEGVIARSNSKTSREIDNNSVVLDNSHSKSLEVKRDAIPRPVEVNNAVAIKPKEDGYFVKKIKEERSLQNQRNK